MTGVAIVLFLIAVPLSAIVIATRSTTPRTALNTHAPRPQPRTVRPVQPQRPVAVAPPEPAPRRLGRKTYMLRQHRKLQRIRAAHKTELELLRAEIARLEAALLERLVLAEVK